MKLYEVRKMQTERKRLVSGSELPVLSDGPIQIYTDYHGIVKNMRCGGCIRETKEDRWKECDDH